MKGGVGKGEREGGKVHRGLWCGEVEKVRRARSKKRRQSAGGGASR